MWSPSQTESNPDASAARAIATSSGQRTSRSTSGSCTPTCIARHRMNVVASPGDLRAWIALLEREGELVRVAAEVDPDLEITEINDRVVKAGGPALLFENVRGSRLPLLINQFGTERRMALAFDAPRLDHVGRKLGHVPARPPPAGLGWRVRGLQK